MPKPKKRAKRERPPPIPPMSFEEAVRRVLAPVPSQGPRKRRTKS